MLVPILAEVNEVGWSAIGAASALAITAAFKGAGNLWSVISLGRRKDKDQTETSYERLFKRQEEQIGRYAIALNGHDMALSEMYALYVNSLGDTAECHRAHQVTMGVLGGMREDMAAAGLKTRPLPEYAELKPADRARDVARAEFIIRTVKQASSILFAADAKRKRDSDRVDTDRNKANANATESGGPSDEATPPPRAGSPDPGGR